MKTRTRQNIIDAIAAVVIAFIVIGVSVDVVLVAGGSQAAQYAFNVAALLIVLPACLHFSSVGERAHSEYYTDTELARKVLNRK